MVRWDDKIGIVMEGKHPETLIISEDQMMRIFTTHAMGGGEAGFLSMMIENLNIASYYTGLPEEGIDQFYLALILDDQDNADLFQEALIEMLLELIPARKRPDFKELLETHFKNIPQFLDLKEEQRYAFIFKNRTRLLLLRKLVEGAIVKEILRKWLSDRVGEEILDIDGLLMPFLKTEVVKQFKLPTEVAEETDCLFLIKDVFYMRVPADRMIKLHKDKKLPEKMYGKYFTQVKNFFKNYKLEETDARETCEVLADPVAFRILVKLRNDPAPASEVLKEINVPEFQFGTVLKEMKKKNIIKESKDGNLYVFTDVTFPTFFPEYMIDSIRRRWGERNISRNLALQHLQLLKGIFQGIPAEIAMFGPKILLRREEEEQARIAAEEKVRLEEEQRIKEGKELVRAEIAKKKREFTPKAAAKARKIEAAAPAFTKKDIKKWIDIKDEELRKVKRNIDTDLYDVAIAPLERAKEAIKNLVKAKYEGAEEQLQKITILEKKIYKRLGKKIIEEEVGAETASATEVDSATMKLREELRTSMSAYDKAIKDKDYNFAIFNLESALVIGEKLNDRATMEDIRMKIENLRSKMA